MEKSGNVVHARVIDVYVKRCFVDWHILWVNGKLDGFFENGFELLSKIFDGDFLYAGWLMCIINISGVLVDNDRCPMIVPRYLIFGSNNYDNGFVLCLILKRVMA